MLSRDVELVAPAGLNVGLTSALSRELQPRLIREFSGHEWAYAGNPYSTWKHPLALTREEYEEDSRLKVIACWRSLAKFFIYDVNPHHAAGESVIAQHLGLSTMLWSTARMPDEVEDETLRAEVLLQHKQADDLHHGGFVPALVKTNVKKKPLYVIPCCDVDCITDDWIKRSPSLKRDVGIERLRRFAAYELTCMDGPNGYFKEEKGQREPIRLKASLSVKQMVDEAIEKLYPVLRPDVRQVAVA